MTAFKVVIPARYGSSRLPAKPLLDIAGQPMVAHVYQRALLSQAQQVVIATDDERIYRGGNCRNDFDRASIWYRSLTRSGAGNGVGR